MRSIFFSIWLLTFPMLMQAQLEGTYCNNHVFGSDCITFLEGDRFSYKSHACGQVSQGEGSYQLIGRRLKLMFSTDSLIIIEELTSVESNRSPDSVFLKVWVKNDSQQPLHFATAVLFNEQGLAIDGTHTDPDGFCFFYIPTSTNTYYIKVSYLMVSMISKPFTADKDWQYHLSLPIHFQIQNGEEMIFHVKKRTTKKLLMKYWDSRRKDPFCEYQKLDRTDLQD